VETTNPPSTRRLSEVTKHLVIPDGIVSSYWPSVNNTCSKRLGITFDRWQEGAGSLILAKRANGKLAHTVGGVGMSLPRQVGKALDLDTELLTANRGWITMHDVEVGDILFHPSGSQTIVTYVSSIVNNRDCYEVITTDNRKLIVDGEHLWTVTDKRLRRERTLTTDDMIHDGLSKYDNECRLTSVNGKNYLTNEYRFALPRQRIINDLPKQDLPIDPYLFGAWLGNGVGVAARISAGDQDLDHWVQSISEAGFIPSVRRDGTGAWDIGVTCEP